MIKISRAAVEQYLNCKRCFVLIYKHKLRLLQLPFTLNSAVDNLCKNEFDYYRQKKLPHPLFKEHNIDAIPFNHKDIDKWRNFRQGISFADSEKAYHFYGAIDDVWIKPNNDLILSDVKSTSKNIFDWEDTWNKYEYPKAYKRQLEMYQWLFRKNGFKVANEAYLIYYNGLKNEPKFNQELKFELHVVKLECNDNWVEETIVQAKDLIEENSLPNGSKYCDTCQYLKKRWNVSQNLNTE